MKKLSQHISEQAFSRNQIINKAGDLAEPIFLHMIKAQMPSQNQDRRKHLHDVAIWITKIVKMKHKGSTIKLSKLILVPWTDQKTDRIDNDMVQYAKDLLERNYAQHIDEININMINNINSIITKIDKHDVSSAKSIMELLEQEL